MGEVGAMPGPGELDQLGADDVVDQPLDPAALSSHWSARLSRTRGQGELSGVEGGFVPPDGPHLRGQTPDRRYRRSSLAASESRSQAELPTTLRKNCSLTMAGSSSIVFDADGRVPGIDSHGMGGS